MNFSFDSGRVVQQRQRWESNTDPPDDEKKNSLAVLLKFDDRYFVSAQSERRDERRIRAVTFFDYRVRDWRCTHCKTSKCGKPVRMSSCHINTTRTFLIQTHVQITRFFFIRSHLCAAPSCCVSTQGIVTLRGPIAF